MYKNRTLNPFNTDTHTKRKNKKNKERIDIGEEKKEFRRQGNGNIERMNQKFYVKKRKNKECGNDTFYNISDEEAIRKNA